MRQCPRTTAAWLSVRQPSRRHGSSEPKQDKVQVCLGIPGRVVEITDPARHLALVDFNGVKRVVNLTCVIDEAHTTERCVGDWVVVHVGFALSRIDEHEAAETLRVLDMLGEAQMEMTLMRKSGWR